jgi:hypothetical protein
MGPVLEAIACGAFLKATRVLSSAEWGQHERNSAVIRNTCPHSSAKGT